MLEINDILTQIDELYGSNQGPVAEELMKESIVQAEAEEDNQALLMLLNELMGYYRETSRVQESYDVADRALKLMESMGLAGSISYATTLLNIANAYRAGGNLEGSLRCYEQTMKIYREQMDPTDMLTASLWNNMSLLYQEMGQYDQAKACLEQALKIVECHADAYFELAVTHTNLASTCLALESQGAGNTETKQLQKEAESHFRRAIEIFEEHGIEDAHYSAALSSLGTFEYRRGHYEKAAEIFKKAMVCMKRNLGENDYYQRLQENVSVCEEAMKRAGQKEKEESASKHSFENGMELCRSYYETYGKPMIRARFGAYADRIAVGLVGEGSDCFGFDDEISRDHDWGPDFCLWVTQEVYDEIGEELEEAYEQLPLEYHGYTRTNSSRGLGRRGVQTIDGFYSRLLGFREWEKIGAGEEPLMQEDSFWINTEDSMLAAAVNGEVFEDPAGIFTSVRNMLSYNFPEKFRYMKLAQSCAMFSQCGQYNYARMLRREDWPAAFLMQADALRYAAKICYYLEKKYPPHDKWLFAGLAGLEEGADCLTLIGKAARADAKEVASVMEELGEYLAQRLYAAHLISSTDAYLDNHSEELLGKAHWVDASTEVLAERIAAVEFRAFDQVRNKGGRADCQNDWYTFSIMRESQYLTWDKEMLLQYLFDFESAMEHGRNLITEKYGRMMESTAPEEYEQIKEYFPALSEQKKAIIEAIVKIQVEWMEAFEKEHPTLAQNARSIRTAEDHLYNTSYETYLRGELGTYSDKLLELYGRYVVACANRGGNLAREIMTNSVHKYGYATLQEAETQMSRLRFPV